MTVASFATTTQRRPSTEPMPVTMPALGESVTEGTVSRWLKKVGDSVETDEPLLEVSTDKVDTEIPSPISGTVLEIRVAEDETVEVGALLADYALRAFRAIRGEGFARVDFFVTAGGEVLLNEVNTIPGFTQFSHYPRMWASAGVPMAELVQLVLERGLAARAR